MRTTPKGHRSIDGANGRFRSDGRPKFFLSTEIRLHFGSPKHSMPNLAQGRIRKKGKSMSKRSQIPKNEPVAPLAINSVENPEENGKLDQGEIADLAYRRWVERGCPQGSADEDWFEAERELRSRGAMTF
jgi:hypothetical protein